MPKILQKPHRLKITTKGKVSYVWYAGRKTAEKAKRRYERHADKVEIETRSIHYPMYREET